METLGLLSGIGHLPVDVAQAAKGMGYHVIAIGVVPGVDSELAACVDVYYDIHIGKLGKIINTLKKNNVTKTWDLHYLWRRCDSPRRGLHTETMNFLYRHS